MKKVVFFLLAFTIFYSCKKDEYASNLQIMSEKAKQELADEVFKGNGTVNFLEYTPISYDTITENKLDTFKLLRINNEVTKLLESAKTKSSLLKSKLNQLKIYKSLEWNDLVDMSKEEFDETYSDLTKDLDKIREYSIQDSIIRSNIENRKVEQTFYRYKAFVKAILTDNSTQQALNKMDTMYMIFDSKLNYYDTSNF